MLTVLLDYEKKEPLYYQIYKGIRAEIRANHLLPDEKLPSKRTLSSHLQVSIITIQSAYDQLVEEGYIRAVPRSGYYVESTQQLPVVSDNNADIISIERETENKKYKISFSTSGVDTKQFPFSTWAKLSRRILSEEQEHLLQAVPPSGLLALRKEIVRYLYEFRSIKILPEQIIIGAGTEYLLSLLVQLLGREKCCAVEEPGYKKTRKILIQNGMSVKSISMKKDGISIKELYESEADIVHVTPSHHFPLGIVMSVNCRASLLNWAMQSSERYIIEDEYDSELRFSGTPIPALYSMDSGNHVIYMNTFAKTLAPSLRISYMILPFTLLKKYQEQLQFYANTVPSFEQYTLASFLREGYFERHLNRMKKTYRKRKDQILFLIRNHKLASYLKIKGENSGLHFLLETHLGLSEKDLIETAESVGVHISGLSYYYADSDFNIEYPTIVIGYTCLTENQIQIGVQTVLDAWQDKFNRKNNIVKKII